MRWFLSTFPSSSVFVALHFKLHPPPLHPPSTHLWSLQNLVVIAKWWMLVNPPLSPTSSERVTVEMHLNFYNLGSRGFVDTVSEV